MNIMHLVNSLLSTVTASHWVSWAALGTIVRWIHSTAIVRLACRTKRHKNTETIRLMLRSYAVAVVDAVKPATVPAVELVTVTTSF